MEKLSIEILKQKFKEAQEKGEELILEKPSSYNLTILMVGEKAIFYRNEVGDEDLLYYGYLPPWQIKQPKDEYEVLYEYTYQHYAVGHLLALSIRNDIAGLTGRKLLKNKRTGEVVKYDESLIK